MDQEFAAKQSIDKSSEKIEQQKPELTMDQAINGLATRMMTCLRAAEARGENPPRFNSADFLMMKGGEGRFSDVYMCRDKITRMEVAVKIFDDMCTEEDIEREVSMLEEISLGNPYSDFTVKFLKQCERDGQTCLVFERLERTIKENFQGQRMTLPRIRVFATQLLLALEELKAVDVLHGDIHPGNIMSVNKKYRPHCIKLIDFGSAIKLSEAQVGMKLQTLEYRAPEILLGLPFTEAIDVWGVGCTLAFLFLGHDLFSASSEDQMMKCIVELLGQPEDHLPRSGKYTQQSSCLEDMFDMTEYRMRSYKDFEDIVAFVDLLKQLLHVDGNQRISARQALKHPFITMDHITNHFEPLVSHHWFSEVVSECSEDVMEQCPALSEYLKYKAEHWTPCQEFPVLSTHWDQEGRNVLYSSSTSYTVLDKIGEGAYSYVLRCQNRTTEEEVAVKVPKIYGNIDLSGRELVISEKINARNPDSKYIIQFLETCEYQGRTCLVFEMLDRSLEDDVEEHGKMTLRSIRPIAKQLFLALAELEALNIRHTDIHQGNFMYVNKQDQPHRVKMIDFGGAIINEPGMPLDHIDTRYDNDDDEEGNEEDDGPVYTNTDMSCVGRSLAFLYFGLDVNPKTIDFQRTLDLCKDSESSTDLMEDHFEDRVAFADLLRQTMDPEVDQRISSSQALQHPYISMDHLINRCEIREYLEASQATMNECPVFSADTVQSSSGCPLDQSTSGSPDGVPVPSPEGVEPADVTHDVSASPGKFRKLLKRFRRVFRQAQRSERKTPPVSASEGVEPKDVTPDVSATSGGLRKFLKRMSRVKRYFSCRRTPDVGE